MEDRTTSSFIIPLVNQVQTIFQPLTHSDKIIFVLGKDMFKKSNIVASIPTRWPFHPTYMHSFGNIQEVNFLFSYIYYNTFSGITENYYIIVEQPLTLSVPKLVFSKFTRLPIEKCTSWYPKEYVSFHRMNHLLLSYRRYTQGKGVKNTYSVLFYINSIWPVRPMSNFILTWKFSVCLLSGDILDSVYSLHY